MAGIVMIFAVLSAVGSLAWMGDQIFCVIGMNVREDVGATETLVSGKCSGNHAQVPWWVTCWLQTRSGQHTMNFLSLPDLMI